MTKREKKRRECRKCVMRLTQHYLKMFKKGITPYGWKKPHDDATGLSGLVSL